MLEAKKNRWFEAAFAVYNRNLLKRRFHSLRVGNLDVLRPRGEQLPRVIYANHSSWWDGLVAFEISRQTRMDSFIMMEEKQLEKLFLFRRLGAFSVVRDSLRQAAQSINYAANLLKEKPDRTLWIFPQGEILPGEARPLKFYRGAAKIIEKTGACFALPLAMRYEFRGEFKPEIFVRIGRGERISIANNYDARELTRRFERELTETLDRLKSDVIEKRFEDYEKIV